MNNSLKQGEKYQKAFESGATYKEIASEFGVALNSVKGRISEYRKEHGILPKERARPSRPALQRRKADYYENTELKYREQQMKLCVVREDGVIQCPTRTAFGYGFGHSVGSQALVKRGAGWVCE